MFQVVKYKRGGIEWGKWPNTKHPKYHFVAIGLLEIRYFPPDLFGIEYSDLDLERVYVDKCPHCQEDVTPENNSGWAIPTKRGWLFKCNNCKNIVGDCFECQKTVTNDDEHILKKTSDTELVLLCEDCCK